MPFKFTLPLGKKTSRGASLIEILVALAIVAVVAYMILTSVSNFQEAGRLVRSRSQATGVADTLSAFVELRTARFLSYKAVSCNNFKQYMGTAFNPAVLPNENLALELSTAANLAPPPVGLTGEAADLKAALKACKADLPSKVTGGTLNFCVTVSRADTTKPANHIGVVGPAFAKVEARLLNAADTSKPPIACATYDATPAKLIEFRYTLYWVEKVNDGYVALSRAIRFFGLADRGA